MSDATETTQEEATVTASEQAEPAPQKAKGNSVLAKTGGVAMAMLGSSTAGNMMAGNALPHADHGHTPARWTASILSMTGFLVGGVLFPFAMIPAGIIAGVFQILAIIAVVALNAAGFGPHDAWGELKAEAAAEHSAA
jgi:hypothetical protein